MDRGKYMNTTETKKIYTSINVYGGHCFADDYLTSIQLLLQNAQKNNSDISVFTYTLPIITMLIAFLESNINNTLDLFNHPNNYIVTDNKTREFIQQIRNDFINPKQTPFLEKYYILMKYYKDINIKSDNRYEKVDDIRKIRNELIHDKSYIINDTNEELGNSIKLLQKYIEPNNNLKGFVPKWLPYFEYNSLCWMTKSIFDFYLWYSELLTPEQPPFYKNKIKQITENLK